MDVLYVVVVVWAVAGHFQNLDIVVWLLLFADLYHLWLYFD